MKILYKKTNFKEVGFSTMAFTAKKLSWCFRHLNNCRLFAQKKAYQGGSRALQDPPSYAPEVVILLKCHGLIFFICMIHILPSPSVTDSKYLILYNVEILPCSFSAGECMKFYVSV